MSKPKINSRRKGHSFEREMCIVFRPWYPKARRGLQYQDGEHCADVEGTPFHIECKRGKKVSIRKAYEQAETDTNGRPILVITKEDRQEVMVTMNFALFARLLDGSLTNGDGKFEL